MNRSGKEFTEGSFLANLYCGHFNWNLIKNFPDEEILSDKDLSFYKQLDDFLRKFLNPKDVELQGKLSDDFISELRKSDFIKLQLDKTDGGPGLKRLQIFRLVEKVSFLSVPAGLCLGGSIAFGASSILEALPPGPVKNYIIKRTREGAISGWADTEPTGAANRLPSMTATLTPDGKDYILNGDKVYINNGEISDILLVSATLIENKRAEARIFVVDTQSEGFKVNGTHEQMGLKGLPITSLTFSNVKVSKDLIIGSTNEHYRDTLLIEPLTSLGRFYTLFSSSLATSKKALSFVKNFCERRKIDQKNITNYDQIKKNIASTAAEIFALDTLVYWCLTNVDGQSLTKRWWELFACKNIGTMTLGRIVDRTISLFGAEGYETAKSKENLGKVALPVEQLYRDARGLRISGGVDFHIDYLSSRHWIDSYYYNTNHQNSFSQFDANDQGNDENLTESDKSYLMYASRTVEELASLVKRLTNENSADQLYKYEKLLSVLNEIFREIFVISLVLSRSIKMRRNFDAEISSLGEIYCSESVCRITFLKEQLQQELKKYDSKTDIPSTLISKILFDKEWEAILMSTK